MADWLVYWRTYWAKVKDPRLVTPDWNSSYDRLYEQAHPGDVIWVVVSGGVGNETQWRLLEYFTLFAKETIDETATGYRYRFLGDTESHELFDPKAPEDFTPILTSLDFASDHRIRFSGRKIGQALQIARELSAHDARTLSIYANGLPRVARGVTRAG